MNHFLSCRHSHGLHPKDGSHKTKTWYHFNFLVHLGSIQSLVDVSCHKEFDMTRVVVDSVTSRHLRLSDPRPWVLDVKVARGSTVTT